MYKLLKEGLTDYKKHFFFRDSANLYTRTDLHKAVVIAQEKILAVFRWKRVTSVTWVQQM